MDENPNAASYAFENPYDTPSNSTQENKPPLESFIPGGAQQTMQSHQQPQQPQQPQPQPKQKAQGNKAGMLAILAIIVIAVIAGGFFALQHKSHPMSSTTSITTTIVPQKMAMIKSCGAINSSGTYYLAGTIKTTLTKGACIAINANNVTLIGNNNRLIGNGPYVGVPPFTYAIFAQDKKNVTIEGIAISNFSYGIYFSNVTNSKVLWNNLTSEVISGIFLLNSSFNNVSNDYVSHSVGKAGAIVLLGGTGNKFVNDTSINNAYYGLLVNSTGNTFINGSFNGNPVDISCNVSAGLRNANFFSSKCSTNLGCSFAACKTSNIPANLSAIQLGTSIKSCGIIKVPGTYYLESNLSMLDYLNMSNPLSGSEACITIDAPSVYLNCQGYSVSNSSYAISVQNNYNDTVKGCVLYNDTYGIYANNVQYVKIDNITIQNSTYGIYAGSIAQGVAKNIRASRNTYGLYIASSTGLIVNNYNLTNNTYGIYFAGGSQNVFNGGKLVSNTKGDLYCTASTYNSTTNLFQNSQCGVTDCNWGSICSQHSLPPISVYPINNCTTISYPGKYALSSGVRASGNCFSIKTSNVSFSCNGHNMLGSGSGTAFNIFGLSNVSINGCNMTKFATGIMARNTTYLSLQGNNITSVMNGIVVANSSFAEITGNKVNGFANGYAYVFANLNKSIITNNSAISAINSNASFVISNSISNLIAFNIANTTASYGFEFNNSPNNQVFNNSAFGNRKADYLCSPSTSGLLAEQNGVNFGYTKEDCKWLVELNINNMQPACYAISTSADINLTNDMLYNIGQTCFNVYNTKMTSGNNTIINCNFHTILATNGGTFVNIVNASNVTVKNCYLKGFTKAITGSGSYMHIRNNTIINSNVSILVANAKYPSIEDNNILNASYGILLENTNYGKIFNNNITMARIALQFAGGISYTIKGNHASNGYIGMYLINSTGNFVQNNTFSNFGRYGINCTGASSNATASGNVDLGGNSCSSNSACYWMKSAACMPT